MIKTIMTVGRIKSGIHYGLHRAIALFVMGAIALTLALALPSLAQDAPTTPTPTPSTTPLTDQLENAISLPGVSGFLTNTAGPKVSRQVVRLDGRRLFAIAVPDVSDRPKQTVEADTNEARTRIIEDRLKQVAHTDFDLASLNVTYEVKAQNKLPIIYVTYTQGAQEKQVELMTVTALDAQIHNTTPDTWAGELTQIIEASLLRSRIERRPDFLRRQGLWALLIVGVALALSIFLRWLQRRLRRQRRVLSEATQQGIEATPASASADPTVTTALLQKQMENREKRRINEIERRLIQISQAIIWGLSGFLILGLFPYTRWLQPLILEWLKIPLQIGLVFVITYLLIRSGEVVIDRFLWIVQDSASLAPELSKRANLRFSTFARVAKSILALVLVSAAVITSLSVIGVQVGPLLAGAGIIGLAISFASQSVIKDMINGFLILLEDQYGVGDVITVGDVAGLVENMNLRITQLRNSEGRLITIPNSSITIVQNLSKEWSRVDLTINVAYHADIDQALQVIDQVAQEMSRDRTWKDIILEPPQLLGIDQLDHVGATIRLWIKTQPLKQWDVAREYRRRLKYAFDAAEIPIGVPQQSLYLSNEEELLDHHQQHPQPKSGLTGNP